MNLQRRNLHVLGAVKCGVLLAFALVQTVHAGETCPSNGSGPNICVAFASGTPAIGFDFTVDYTTDPANPSVTLRAGNLTWNVRCDDSGSPGNIGSIILDPSDPADNFEVTIANGKAAGAGWVSRIDLNPGGTWTGWSAIGKGSRISNGLYGAFEVVDNGSDGGYADDFTVEGNVTTDMTLPHAAGFTIEGALYNANLSTWDVTNGTLRIGSAENHAGVSTSLVNGILQVDAGTGDVLALFNISSMDSTSSIRVAHTQTPGAESISLDLVFASDVPSGATIDLSNARYAKGAIVMGIAGQYDMLGDIDVYEWDAVFFGADLGGDFTVTDDFASAFPHFHLTGDLTATGSIDIGGDYTSGAINIDGAGAGDILIAGAMLGTIAVDGIWTGDVHVSGDATGSIEVGKLGRAGRILVDGLGNGQITVGAGTLSSSFIHLHDGLGTNGAILIDDASGGIAPVGANGDIQVGPDVGFYPIPSVTYDGEIKIVGNLRGDIDVNGCHSPADLVDICVCGTNSGTITVADAGCSTQIPSPYYECPAGTCP